MLLKIGKCKADVKDNRGETPLHIAASKGHTPIVQMLLDTGEVDLESINSMGRTPLFEAVGGVEETIRILLDHGADVNWKDGEGKAVLSRGAQ
ncbi:hypothetical protein M441DRAFT_205868 [Trichoderma asperellum CBS 433.97]|uniref:Uncharacterized protein n=1 Tax=Trichoderma asperellum (strain ATCC 204424 / CBS 433.97 / NBRC 101777) TaxID=1042311 RepID=A0A2T3YQM5_TRIA4|nr:hypothetical protein M441DRAFT_205868 [Trichoderma asperellum CBS 433.97]PTB34868.1 hypothetical protein M441DRAFT_205868 [Trichoderma asperellum CBS 433.97]